jgi:glucoside 3-dehydrogenase (cytochrome c) catalytic subunit
MLKRTNEFDAIVVGSGISGGWAAKELTEKGLKVLVLERGAELQHGIGYLGEHAPDWKIPFNGKPNREEEAEDYPIQSQNYAFSEANKHFYNNDKKNPYVRHDDKPFNWIRGDVVGGRSLLWGRQVYRFSEQDFNANAVDGVEIPWPVKYDDIAPWYSYVEKYIGVSGQAEGLKQLPDSEFMPPMEMYALEKTVKKRLADKAPDITMTIGRVAIITENHNGRGACHYCGPCHRGCSTGSYFSSHSSTLPAARATGNLTLRANSVVEKLVYDDETGKVSSVNIVDAKTGERQSFSAKIFFLCASTIGSTQIMLNSKSVKFPNGLANSSGALGKYLMDHYLDTAGMGVFLDDVDRYHYGNRPNGIYIPRFRNLEDKNEDTDFIRGYGFQGLATRLGWRARFNKRGFGAELKEDLRKPSTSIFGLGGFLECLPKASNQVTVDNTKLDRFGIPQASIKFEWSENELNMAKDMKKQAERILKAAGAVYIMSPEGTEFSSDPTGGMGVHEMGTARMGDDPTKSVLNKHNQAHDVPNLFVTDGSFMTSSSCVNPSLTYMAFTARACDYAVKELEAGNI